jgi:hypothetical protein
MRIKMYCQFGLLLLSLALGTAKADSIPGQTVQINTRFNIVYGKPSWLIIIRDEDTGRILPYIFDVQNNDNFWIALTAGRSYRITASTLSFGPFAEIHNFCYLEDGILTAKSMFISLSGDLSPIRNSSNCRVMKYNDVPFPIAH